MSSFVDQAATVAKGRDSALSWKTLALVTVGGVAAVSTTLLAMQWKHASLGRKVQNDVVDFLKLHGSVVSDRHISGGFITAPKLAINEAVISTIETIIKDLNTEVRKRQQSSSSPPAPQHQPSEATMSSTRPSEFPEPTISGKTGEPVRRESNPSSPSTATAKFGDFEMPDDAKNSGDYSYIAPTPVGQIPTRMPE